MIARIYIWILLGTLLPYLWCFCHELRRYCLARRLLLWLPASVVIGYSGYLALQPNFVPDRPVLVDVWFVVMALFAVPVFVYALFSFVGWCVMKALKGRCNWGRLIGLVMGLLSVGVFLYGFTYGFRELEVKRVTIAVPQLPASFDGYRIVLFSDFHAGSYYGWRSDLPQRDVDSINAQHPDMICFTGDIQNTRPSELKPYVRMLSYLTTAIMWMLIRSPVSGRSRRLAGWNGRWDGICFSTSTPWCIAVPTPSMLRAQKTSRNLLMPMWLRRFGASVQATSS